MKKYLRFADILVLICGTLGMLLQLWLFSVGTDAKGLYPAMHPAWILSWILSAGVLVFIWLLTRQPGNNRSYKANFPASIPGAISCAAAAVLLLIAGFSRLQSGSLWLDTISGFLGIFSGAGLLVAGVCRYLGKKPPFLCFMLPCIFFALHIFYLGRELGGEPEPVRYLFRFLATLSLIPACYQLWGFSVDSGERQNSLFWSLFASYLCILSAPAGESGLLYLVMGLWLLTNSCALKYLPRRNRPVVMPEPEETADPVEVTPEIPSTMAEDFSSAPESVAEIPKTADPAEPKPELDADAIIAEILREIDSNVP